MDRTSAWRLARGDRREYRRPLSEATRTRAYVPQKLVNQLTFSRRPHRLLLHPCCLLLSISNLSTFPYPSQALQQQYKHCHIGLCSDVIFTTGFTLPAMFSFLFFPSLFLRPFPRSHHYCLSPCPCFHLLSISNLSTFSIRRNESTRTHIGLCSYAIFTTRLIVPPILFLLSFSFLPSSCAPLRVLTSSSSPLAPSSPRAT